MLIQKKRKKNCRPFLNSFRKEWNNLENSIVINNEVISDNSIWSQIKACIDTDGSQIKYLLNNKIYAFLTPLSENKKKISWLYYKIYELY